MFMQSKERKLVRLGTLPSHIKRTCNIAFVISPLYRAQVIILCRKLSQYHNNEIGISSTDHTDVSSFFVRGNLLIIQFNREGRIEGGLRDISFYCVLLFGLPELGLTAIIGGLTDLDRRREGGGGRQPVVTQLGSSKQLN